MPLRPLPHSGIRPLVLLTLCLLAFLPLAARTDDGQEFITKLATARAALKDADEVVLAISPGITNVKGLTQTQAADSDALKRLQALTAAVRALVAQKPATFEDKAANLTKAQVELKELAAKLTTPTGDVKTALDAYNNDKIDTKLGTQSTALKEIKKALDGVSDSGKKYAERLAERLAKLAELAPDAKTDALLATLPKELPPFPDLLRQRRELDSLASALQDAGVNSLTTTLGTAGESFNARIKAVLVGFATWPAALEKATGDRVLEAEKLYQKVLKDPLPSRPEVAQLAQSAPEFSDTLRTITTQLTLALTVLDGVEKTRPYLPDGFAPEEIRKALRRLDLGGGKLLATANLVQEGLLGDLSEWVAEQVPLYYFDNAVRLIQVMNSGGAIEMGGVPGLREKSEEQRRLLDQATQDLLDARQGVNDARRKLEELEGKLKQELSLAQAALRAAQGPATQSAGKVARLTREQSAAQLAFDATKRRHDAVMANPNATDEQKRKAIEDLELAQQRLDKAKADLMLAAAEDTPIQQHRTDAAGRITALNDEQQGLRAQLKQAETDAATAQSTAQKQISQAYLAAQTESLAFAQARDNAPFWYSAPNGASTDPARRCILFSFNDSKTVFIRGRLEDVLKVKELIGQFDRPSGQALMTLWSLEINSDGSTTGATRSSKALDIIEAELRHTRLSVDTALAFLRDCVTRQVRQAVADDSSGLVAKIQSSAETLISKEDKQSPLGQDPVTGTRNLEAAAAFYDPLVLRALGWRGLAPEDELSSLLFTTPNPTGTTTLAETVIVLALAREKYRHAAITEFNEGLSQHLTDRIKTYPEDKEVQREFEEISAKLQAAQLVTAGQRPGIKRRADWFPAFRRFMETGLQPGIPNAEGSKQSADGNTPDQSNRKKASDAEGVSPGLSSFQREVILSILRNALGRLVDHAGDLQASITKIDRRLSELEPKARELKEPELSELPQLQTRKCELEHKLIAVTTLIADLFGGTFNEVSKSVDNPKALRRALARFGRIDSARIAAANEKMKQFIKAVDEDVQYHFIQPMFRDMRDRLIKTHVGVGVLQRTTVLSTNRLVARVDPKGSANLGLGETQDVLAATMQLAQLATATQTGGLSALLGGLDTLPKEAPPGIYGIGTGNVFQVTPIADPSGQALRFRFDHVSATQVREPNRTTDPQLSRIERHTINTEVQLSNLEIREISRFQANARLGLPRRLKGGIPVLNNIPVVREIPLIGWFTKRTGKAASVQQSLVLGQTTLFPTIGDVVDLLTLPPALYSVPVDGAPGDLTGEDK